MHLTLAPGVLEEVVKHARACYPREGCGLIAGRAGLAERFIPMSNALGSSTAYEMDPGQLVAALRSMREAGEDLAAIYHSHPSSGPLPSTRDTERAHYPEAAYLIVSLERPDSPAVQAFRIVDGRVDALELRAIV